MTIAGLPRPPAVRARERFGELMAGGLDWAVCARALAAALQSLSQCIHYWIGLQYHSLSMSHRQSVLTRLCFGITSPCLPGLSSPYHQACRTSDSKAKNDVGPTESIDNRNRRRCHGCDDGSSRSC